MDAGYKARLVDPLVAELVAEFPALSLVGPRASGKTTTAQRHAASVIHVDDPELTPQLRRSPDALLRGRPEPVLLDEWQEAPEVLGAVKRAVDADPRPGRFILTGSVRAELDVHTWPGTGRVIHVPMTGLTMREKLDRTGEPAFLDRFRPGAEPSFELPEDLPDLRDYVDMALEPGFPEPALRRGPRGRRRWFDGYVMQLLNRDAAALEPRRDPARMRKYLEALALNTAGVVEQTKLIEVAGINRKTAVAYENLLSNLFILDVVPSWFTNRLKRLSQGPKRYVVDPALAGTLIDVDTDGVLKDSDLLGRLIDTFVLAQIRAELPLCELRPRVYHLRQDGGRREVDIIIELAGERIIAIEVKAGSNLDGRAHKHLAWLRDELGDRFLHGLVLNSGKFIEPLGERITAAPICALWG